MDNVILIVVLVSLAIVLAAASNKEGIFGIAENYKKRKNIPTAILPEKQSSRKKEGGTIILPDLELHQLNDDNSVFFTHEISKHDMFDEDGDMVGMPVSHPGSDCDGLILFGKKKKDGSYDEKDPSTYAALTVNTRAISIGYDEQGFYGEVTNPNARVYKVVENKTQAVPYREFFEIADGTYILVGLQWLCFTTPVLPEFPGKKVADRQNGNDRTRRIPSKTQTKGIGRTNGIRKRKIPTNIFVPGKDKDQNSKKISIRFPIDD